MTERPPTTADENSREAADSMMGSAANLRAYVLDVIRTYGPIAEWQIEQATQMAGNTVRPRVWELFNDGRIKRVGKNRTPAGRQAWLYVVTEGRPDAEHRLVVPVKPWSVEAVPVFDRWACEVCGTTVTMEEHGQQLQPALGGYKQGQCPDPKCHSNSRNGRTRGTTMFVPVKR